MSRADQVKRQPRHKKIEEVVDRGLTDACTPRRPMAEDIEIAGFAGSGFGVVAPSGGHPDHPERQPDESRESQRQEEWTPAKAGNRCSSHEHSECRTESQPCHN